MTDLPLLYFMRSLSRDSAGLDPMSPVGVIEEISLTGIVRRNGPDEICN